MSYSPPSLPQENALPAMTAPTEPETESKAIWLYWVGVLFFSFLYLTFPIATFCLLVCKVPIAETYSKPWQYSASSETHRTLQKPDETAAAYPSLVRIPKQTFLGIQQPGLTKPPHALYKLQTLVLMMGGEGTDN